MMDQFEGREGVVGLRREVKEERKEERGRSSREVLLESSLQAAMKLGLTRRASE